MGTGQSYLNQLVDRVVRADEGSRARSVKDRLFLSGTNMRLLDHRDDAELDEADEMEFGPAVELGSRHLATRRPPPSHRETDENEDLAWHIPIRDLYRHGAGKAQNRYRAQVQRVDAWLVKRGYLPTPEADQGRSEGNPHPGALRIQGARAAGLWQPNTGRVQPLPGSVFIFENPTKAGKLDGRMCWGRTYREAVVLRYLGPDQVAVLEFERKRPQYAKRVWRRRSRGGLAPVPWIAGWILPRQAVVAKTEARAKVQQLELF